MRRRRTKRLGLLAAVAACAVAAIGAQSGQATVAYQSSFGGTGTGPGQFSPIEYGPGGVAVNEANGHVYVADPGQNRVEEFDASGAFVSMFGQGVDQTTGGNVCTAASGHTCQAGASGGSGGAMNRPQGVGVDSSTGDVYVQDANNNRVDKFDGNGEFVLAWGKGVDATTGGDICTAASGHTCKKGSISGSRETTPITPSANGEFAGWEQANDPGLAVDEAGYVYVTDPHAVPNARVQKFDSNGNFVSQIASSNVNFYDRGLNFPQEVAVAPSGDVYVLDEGKVKQFHGDEFTQDGLSARWQQTYEPPHQFFGGIRQLAVDPSNGFILTGTESENPCPDGTAGSYRIDEFHPSGQLIDCTVIQSPSIGANNYESGMADSIGHRLYVGDRFHDMVRVFASPVASPPEVVEERSREITSKTVTLDAEIAANLGDTTYRIEYGTSPCSTSQCESTPESSSIGAAIAPVAVSRRLEDLQPETTYYYRFVATNGAGSNAGPDRRFATFASPTVDNSCENNLARQQTRSTLLLDCRAYELVSAEDTGGYNVESDLVPGGEPFGGFPLADGRALYAVHDGGIPGSGNPTNRGPDPYVATRDAAEERWVTKYVGVPANAPSAVPFRSEVEGADQGLGTFAFGGPDICRPCFEDGSAGIPVRRPDGELMQGMGGSMPVAEPEPAGVVAKPVSGDGSTLVFGSVEQFESAGNDSGTDVTYYARKLGGGGTEVVSTLPDGATIAAGDEVQELDVSRDGSRVLIGQVVGTDASGQKLWHLYLHERGDSHSVDITPGASSGVLYDGMTSDGSQVYFTTTDALASDSDTSADIYRAAVSGASAALTRVSTGTGGSGDTDSCDPSGNSYNPENWNVGPGGPTDCSVVAIGGAGGVAPGSGVIYFLSPEQLDGNGEAGAPNLFRAAPGSPPAFVATLESSANAPLEEASHVFQKSIGSFSNPEGTAIDPVDGSVYVFDTDETVQTPGAYVQKFDASGKVDSSFGSGGKINGSNTTKGEFAELGNGGAVGLTMGIPISIAVDTDPSSPNYRDLYVADLTHQVIDRFDREGNFLGEFGVSFPSGVAVSPSDGNVYVSSIFGNVKTYEPNGTQVAPEFEIPFFSTSDLAVDTSGNIYVTDGTKTTKYDSAGTELEVLDSNPSYGVAVDPTDDHAYVDEGSRVVEYDASGNQVGGPIGADVIEGMASLSVQAGRMLVGNPGPGNVAEFSPPITPPNRGYDNPLVLDAVREPAVRRTADFQTNTSGGDAVFPSTLPLTGFESGGHYNVFRYDAGSGNTDCVSCNPTLLTPTSDATLPRNGLGLTDDGRVFFTSGEPLVLQDTNELKDPYEWKNGKAELISTGKSQYDSGLLTVTADGTDALFFTRETLTENDRNGTLMKLYDARAGGGFLVIPPPPPCAASDECHGPASQAPPPAKLGTLEGEGRNAVRGPGCSPSKLAHAAKRLAKQAKRLSARAGTASGKQGAALRRKAKKAERKAKRARARLKQCTSATGGTK